MSDFFAAGLVSAAVNLHYGGGAVGFPDDFAYEIQYSPYGVDSGLCAGVGTTAVAGTKVALEPCGVSSKTVWIVDSADSTFSGYVPLINGSDTNFSQPFVLTYGATATRPTCRGRSCTSPTSPVSPTGRSTTRPVWTTTSCGASTRASSRRGVLSLNLQ